MLDKLVVDVKEAWVSYPGIEGFEVLLAYHSRPRLMKIRKDCLITKIDRKTRVPTEVLDEEKFTEVFTTAIIKGWKGLTLAGLEELMPVDVADLDLDTEIPYSKEDAIALVRNSTEFDVWVNEVVFDLQNFRTTRD